MPNETEWVEFKTNDAEPKKIGEYISALSNSAALVEQPTAYLVWGIRDSDREIVGTTFKPKSTKVGNEDLENWLLRSTRPQIHFTFHSVEMERLSVVVLEIERATHLPIRFQDDEFIRVGSYKKNLRDHPDHARRLWKSFDQNPFESGIAAEDVRDDEVLRLLDYPAYFDLHDLPLPENRSGILGALATDQLIVRTPAGEWNITNLGAMLFAKSIAEFTQLKRKAVRVVQYRGSGRIETIREQEGVLGYAAGFSGIIEYVVNLLPSNEVIGQALRETVPMYPKLAIRELIANALIHQDFTQTGVGPIIEIFDTRLEITSPGLPLVDPARFVDAPPRSRNEALASMMRRVRVCEERGSGWDKIAFEIDYHQLPAPLIETPQSHTRIVLFSPRSLREMDREDRVRAVYLHACLRYVNREHMNNSSIRTRFGIEARNSATASRLIGEAVEAGVIAPYDPHAPRRLMRYVPYWASDSRADFV
ncbi:MAG: RNA-binding domain-containing protein [Pseudonocardiaceae bacterium]